MKRKGNIALDRTVDWALLLILLMVIMFGFFRPWVPKTVEYMRMWAGQEVNFTGFTPYITEDHFSLEERVVDDSMKALVCAIESTIKGELDPASCDAGMKVEEAKKEICCRVRLYSTGAVGMGGGGGLRKDEHQIMENEEDCTELNRRESGFGSSENVVAEVVNSGCFGESCPVGSLSFGRSCVKEKENNKGEFEVINFHLPQSKDDFNYGSWLEWIGKTGDPKYLAYYQVFPQGEEKQWAVDAMKLSVTWLVISGVLNPILAMGPKQAAMSFVSPFRKVVRQEGEAALKRTAGKAAKESIESGAELGESSIKNSLDEILSIFREGFKRQLSEDKLIRWSIISQKYSHYKNEFFNALDIMGISSSLRMGQTKEEIVGILARRVKNTRINNKDFFEGLADNLLSNDKSIVFLRTNKIAGAVQRGSGTNAQVGRGVHEAKWIMENAPDLYKKGQFKISDLGDDALRNKYEIEASGLNNEYFKRIGSDLKGRDSKETIALIQKELAKKDVEMLVYKDLANDLFILNSISGATLRSVQSTRNILKQLVILKGDDMVIDQSLVRGIMDDLPKIIPNDEAMDAAVKSFSDIDPRVFLDDAGMFRLGSDLTPDAAVAAHKVLHEESGAAVEGIWNSMPANQKKLLEGVWVNLFGSADGFTGFVKNQIPFSMSGLRYGAIAGGAAFGPPGAMLGGVATGGTAGVANFALQHRYFTAFLLYLYATHLDSMDEKFYWHAGDTIVLSQPRYHGTAGREYRLSDSAAPNFLSLVKDDGTWNRFFLASPCAANIGIKKNACTCSISSGDWLIDYGGYMQPILGHSVTDKEKAETYYYWDSMGEQKRKRAFFPNSNAYKEDIGTRRGYNYDIYADQIMADDGLFEEFLHGLFIVCNNAKKYIEMTDAKFDRAFDHFHSSNPLSADFLHISFLFGKLRTMDKALGPPSEIRVKYDGAFDGFFDGTVTSFEEFKAHMNNIRQENPEGMKYLISYHLLNAWHMQYIRDTTSSWYFYIDEPADSFEPVASMDEILTYDPWNVFPENYVGSSDPEVLTVQGIGADQPCKGTCSSLGDVAGHLLYSFKMCGQNRDSECLCQLDWNAVRNANVDGEAEVRIYGDGRVPRVMIDGKEIKSGSITQRADLFYGDDVNNRFESDYIDFIISYSGGNFKGAKIGYGGIFSPWWVDVNEISIYREGNSFTFLKDKGGIRSCSLRDLLDPLETNPFESINGKKERASSDHSLLWKAARKAHFHFSVVSPGDVNREFILKECRPSFGAQVPNRQGVADILASADMPLPIPGSMQDAKVITSCIGADVDLYDIQSENYCYSSIDPNLNTVRWVLFGSFIAVDTALTAYTGGLSKLVFLGISGAGYTLISESTTKKWPEH